MKKISNRMSVKKSSTLAGQRELLREHTNKINELVESITNLENREAKHELDVITSMQYLENRVEELKDELKMLTTEVHVNLDKPYTAMRSTGEVTNEELNDRVDDFPSMKEYCYCISTSFHDDGKGFLKCDRCGKYQQPIKSQEDVETDELEEKIKELFYTHGDSAEFYDSHPYLISRVLAIVKGE